MRRVGSLQIFLLSQPAIAQPVNAAIGVSWTADIPSLSVREEWCYLLPLVELHQGDFAQ